MTILSVVQEVCPVIGLSVPVALFTSTDGDLIQLRNVANEMAQRIAATHDWQLLKRINTHTGDGSTEDFDLPGDYDRMTKDSQVWSSSLETPLSHIPSTNEWLGLDVQSFDFVINAWTIYGGQIHIKPALASAVTAKYFYQSNLLVSPASGADKALFTADDDTYRLSERVLKLGIIWEWCEQKGMPYPEKMETYEDARAKAAGNDKGATVIAVGRPRLSRGVTVAYPQSITPT